MKVRSSAPAVPAFNNVFSGKNGYKIETESDRLPA